jgi:hypothetical protein
MDEFLVSDANGNAFWKEPSVVTSGLWKAIGTTGNIENGNTGNVGVGTNNPIRKVQINGKTFVGVNTTPDPAIDSALEVNAGGGRGIAIKTANNDILNLYGGSGSSVSFTIVDHVGRGLRFYDETAPSGHKSYFQINPDGNSGFGTYPGDIKDKLTVKGTLGVERNITNRGGDTLKIASDPNNNGSWLTMYNSGSTANAGNLHFVTRGNGQNNCFRFYNFNPSQGSPYREALKIEGNGNMWVNGAKPFAKRTYTVTNIGTVNGMRRGQIATGFNVANYEAIIAGFEVHDYNFRATALTDNMSLYFKISPGSGTTWYVEVHAPTHFNRADDANQYKVSVLFIRKELVG